MVRHVARARGFIDPVQLISRLESFAQPIEVKEPIELLRAGIVFHARGLLNTGAIQHNLDWIWPYWVERQYNPEDEAFIPRAFSITHVNLSNRNWTAVGSPDLDELPIVDPRGLLTPFWDGWSLDGWIVVEDGRCLIPSKLGAVDQSLDLTKGIAVVTHSRGDELAISSRIDVEEKAGRPICQLELTARSTGKAWLVLALRPYNPEGVSFIHDICLEPGAMGWRVGRHHTVRFDPPADRCLFSDYRSGDVYTRLFAPDTRQSVHCDVGMATAAAVFAIQGDRPKSVCAQVPLAQEAVPPTAPRLRPSWCDALSGTASVKLPDERLQLLYEAAIRSLILHTPGEVYPGPYTYKRFWFRDAAFILHASLCVGLVGRVARVLDRFPERQTRAGFFHSQDGEWDSNGEALWILRRFCQLTGQPPKPAWQRAIRRGGRWIQKKRLSAASHERHAGLLPPGFSAEHLGPNDYYYWDDFWGVAGLWAAGELLEILGDEHTATDFRGEAALFLESIEGSLSLVATGLGRLGMPASPYRRLDSGAIGSLAAGYPLQLFSPTDERLLDTAAYLLDHCLVRGGFYQDIIHSGINPYLTLHLAQVLRRAGDPRSLDLVQTVAALASPTGQ